MLIVHLPGQKKRLRFVPGPWQIADQNSGFVPRRGFSESVRDLPLVPGIQAMAIRFYEGATK
jgi:hypothetical protein